MTSGSPGNVVSHYLCVPQGGHPNAFHPAIWSSFADLKQSFNAPDSVAPCVVFDIGGNKYGLIAEMNFARRVVFIRFIMTHKEYMKGAWKS